MALVRPPTIIPVRVRPISVTGISTDRNPYGAGTVTTIVSDTFTRADTDVTLGAADTGQSWTALGSAVFGIGTNQAKYVSGDIGNNIYAVIDAGVSDASVQVTLSVSASGSYMAFRVTDINNLWILAPVGGAAGYQVYKRVAGTYSQVGSDANIAMADGAVVKVACSGNNFTVYIDGVSCITGTDSFSATATKFGIGLQGVNTAARWDNFTITVP